MADDISKLCSDFLRETCPGLKASHARELVAAFFGYKSHAALLSETRYSVDKLEEAGVLIPDISLMDERKPRLTGLPEDLPEARWMAENIASYLQEQNQFFGDVWFIEEDLLTYMLEEYLPNNVDGDLDDYLADVMAETNAYFDDPYYDSGSVESGLDSVKIVVPGTYNGGHDTSRDRMFAGDTIDMQIVVELARVAGRAAFAEPAVDVTGEVRRDYYDDDEPAA